MHALRYLTLVWPGLPWLWLRGSLSGLFLAMAFAVSVDMAILATFVWPGLVELPFTLGLWTAVAVLWLISTVSAAAAFPPAIAAPRRDEADALFVQARDAYLARDWVQTEARLQDLLTIAPTDGEAQLLHASLLRRHEIAAELDRLADSSERHAGEEPAVLPLRDESGGQNPRSAAA
jgi:hypothetical protein